VYLTPDSIVGMQRFFQVLCCLLGLTHIHRTPRVPVFEITLSLWSNPCDFCRKPFCSSITPYLNLILQHTHIKPLLSRLSALPFLSSLSLENRVISPTTAKLLPLEALIAAGTNVLRVARGRGQKVLTVWIFKGQTEFELDPVVIYVE
jgi:hypothetical protein